MAMIIETKVIKILKLSTKLETSSHPKAQIDFKHPIFFAIQKNLQCASLNKCCELQYKCELSNA